MDAARRRPRGAEVIPAVRWISPFLIVFMISTGQILFKLSADMLRQHGGRLSLPVLGVTSLSLVIYGAATIGWIWLLQTFRLSAIYPVMALSFVLVPLGSAWIFGDRLSLGYALGTLLLLAGLLVIILSQGQAAG